MIWKRGLGQRRLAGLPRPREAEDRVVSGVSVQVRFERPIEYGPNLRSDRKNAKGLYPDPSVTTLGLAATTSSAVCR